MKFQPELLLMLFFFYCYIGFSSSSSSFSSSSTDETSVLLSIKASLIDPLNHLQDWKFPNNGRGNNSPVHCNWTGVKCSSNGSVQKLDLSRLNLSGIVSDEIQQLQSLTSLNLCCNGFSSPLPKSLSNLTSLKGIDVSQNLFLDNFPVGFGRIAGLRTLNASSNNFSGDIPEDLGNATLLERLDLRGNFFQRSIPKSLKNLGKLEFLGLSGNNLTGQLPPELGQLSSLETMVLGYNEFEGEIPAAFGNLTNLRYLDLAVGNLGGAIPANLGRLKILDTIFLYKNNLEGKIPPEIGNATSLQILDLSDNMLSGEVPADIARLKNLQLLNLMCNQLSGSLPSGLGGLAQLEVLELWNNSFLGPLPRDLGLNSPLQWLDISSNAFSGHIPTSLCSGGNLTKLILFNNAFSGPIPSNLSTCSSLIRVRMQNNLLSGAIPIGFGELGKLQRLELANNSLTGQIPSDIASSTSLCFLDFSLNRLQSSLPSAILSIPNLQNFMASENNLGGEIPDQFQDCPSLSVLDISSNHFTGIIPASIASCGKLVTLNLRNNQLTGPIPVPIASMPTLSVLDLSNNSLTGGIPENFGNSPALETLNLSHNKLEGPVPANGMLRTINSEDLVGNSGLCDGVLPPCPQYSTHNKRNTRAKHIVAGWLVGTSSVLAVLIALIGARSMYRKWYSSNGSCFKLEKLEMSKGDWPWRLMAFQRLCFTSNDILGCIKETNVIGMGATGTVYRAEIQRLNTVVAVKKLWRTESIDVEMGKNSSTDYLVGEVNLLGRLRHRNIVRLLGFLHNGSEAMIVYEYMENGSLGEALHGKGGDIGLLADWVLRYNIAVGVAQGLAYLHHDCHPPVIHRDVKSNNILLDANLEARIADFGLAKLMLKKNQTVSVVAGSYGYIAPEYGYTMKVDEKSDIYSYGVVLMELLTGKPPLDPRFGESMDMVEWIRRKIRDNKRLEEEVLDPNVGNCKHVQEEMLLVLQIALLCTAKLPKDRPSMRDVITMLGEAKPRRKTTSGSGGGDHHAIAADKEFTTSPVNGLLEAIGESEPGGRKFPAPAAANKRFWSNRSTCTQTFSGTTHSYDQITQPNRFSRNPNIAGDGPQVGDSRFYQSIVRFARFITKTNRQ